MALHERPRVWRDHVCGVFGGLELSRLPAQGFDGSIRTADAGALRIAHVTCNAHEAHRSPRAIADAPGDHFILGLQCAGSRRIEQDGRETLVRPGDSVLYDAARPYRLSFLGDVEQIIVKLPRASLKRRIGVPENITAIRVEAASPGGAMLGNFLSTLAQKMSALTEAQLTLLSENISLLTAMAFQPLLPHPQSEESAFRLSMRLRVMAYIEEHLGDPGLSVGRIAAAHGVSARYVHMLFEGQSHTVSRWIWEQRLEMCRRDIADPALAQASITEIAYRWGFSESAHFSRAFRRRFGTSPREWRRARLAD